MASNVKWARNLQKSQLGGIIFGCTKDTMRECLANQLFGLPAQHFLYVKNIEPGLPLFLFNYSERNLHGIYEAASSGKMSIDSYAWTADGSDRTKYPAQVQIRVRLQCQALPEYQFKPIIIDNYYSQSHFWFELDHAQASRLMSKFSSLGVAPRPFIPQNPPKWNVKMQRFPSNDKREESGAAVPPPLTDDFANSNDSIGTSVTSEDSVCLDQNNQLMEPSLRNQMVEFDEKGLIYMKLKELSLSCESRDTNMIGHLLGDASTSEVDLEHETHDADMVNSGKRSDRSSLDSLDYPAIIAQLVREMEELKTFKQEQTEKMEILEKKLAEAEQEIHRLENRCVILESISNTSVRLSGDNTPIESPDGFYSNLNESILIVGGYDGISWSPALHSFLPSHDVLRSLKPMSSARSYASVASFNGDLYVFGGGTGSTWYDTVESYNALNDEWSWRPSLNKEKGSLAGAALNGKIFAVGGGNGVECFSDVEMFDPCVGRWISARSMLEKRFALAAVELNGALYVVGGYDGNDYLKSAERFDPREHSWSRIESMDAKRGCHSLVAMNEKLYALGGFDGITMVPSVEIYDPRRGTWMTGEPMNQGRGYSAAAVLKDSIYVVGGVKTDEDIVDMIECYKEGQGWEATKLRAVGKRCFASAIVLQVD
ncbi:kelch-like protein 1 isoform X1 [Sesamum indicum]|uniref:Kelch-like protein 1 isoform X1 n=1 Tax=Sesamum indicum TaxID=4182 RepID=A0A6I9TA63_SESIN|nr:kelch-like protein 1 isoform X1 [Sesamum indicum]XP_011077512.1 kelch-like protein 1 isoform X1 [Sesamum indicum]